MFWFNCTLITGKLNRLWNKNITNFESFPITIVNHSTNTNSNSQSLTNQNSTKSFLYSDNTFDKHKELRNKSEDKEKYKYSK